MTPQPNCGREDQNRNDDHTCSSCAHLFVNIKINVVYPARGKGVENHPHQTSIKLEVGPCQLAHLLSYATRCRVKAVLYVPRLTEWTNRPRGVTSADQRQHSLGSVVFCVWARSRPGNVSWEAIVANNSLSLWPVCRHLSSRPSICSPLAVRAIYFTLARAHVRPNPTRGVVRRRLAVAWRSVGVRRGREGGERGLWAVSQATRPKKTSGNSRGHYQRIIFKDGSYRGCGEHEHHWPTRDCPTFGSRDTSVGSGELCIQSTSSCFSMKGRRFYAFYSWAQLLVLRTSDPRSTSDTKLFCTSGNNRS